MNPQPANTQQAEFAFRTLPDLFHQDPDQFIQLLERNGNRFLNFYWDEAGKRINQTEKVVPYGIDYAMQHPNSLLQAAWITFPDPTRIGEAWLGAFIFRPTRVTMIPGVNDVARVLVLMNTSDVPGENKTSLVQITRRLEFFEVGKDILPDKIAFHSAVADIVNND
jgi:hypothetical protein